MLLLNDTVVVEPCSPFTLLQIVRIVLVEFGFHFKCARTVSVFIDLSVPNLVVCEQVIQKLTNHSAK